MADSLSSAEASFIFKEEEWREVKRKRAEAGEKGIQRARGTLGRKKARRKAPRSPPCFLAVSPQKEPLRRREPLTHRAAPSHHFTARVVLYFLKVVNIDEYSYI